VSAVATARSQTTLRVNPIACDAHGICAELFPERITLDAWGYPMIDGRPIEPELLEHARRAADACPRAALLLKTSKRS
jgi:ferredoxin